MANPHAIPITVSETDRATLLKWRRRRSTAQGFALRANIILACAERGVSNLSIAKQLHISNLTVGKWRRRYAEHGIEGLVDAPRSGAPRSISDEQVEQVVMTTLQTTPKNATHWSSRQLAAHLGMSQTAICRIWHAFALAPHRSRTFKLSTDPFFVDKVRDIVGLYLNPPQRALVLCVDEKPSIQAIQGTAPVMPMRPGQLETHTHDYLRHGTTDLFAALNVLTGTVIGEVHRRHRSVEFRHFLNTIEHSTPRQFELHLILDNSSIHKTPLIQRWLVRHPRVHLHFTPTSGSWLNLVECWFAILTARQLKRGEFTSVRSLETAIRAYLADNNVHPKPFVWHKTADEILAAVSAFCERTSDSYH
jgi:transposase